jgi:hypothetical protein
MTKNESEFYYKGKYEESLKVIEVEKGLKDSEKKMKQLYKKLFFGLLIVCLSLLAMSWVASLVESSNSKIINKNENTQKLDYTK